MLDLSAILHAEQVSAVRAYLCDRQLIVTVRVLRGALDLTTKLDELRHFPRLDMARGHGLVVEGLGVEVDRLVLVHGGVTRLAANSSHIVRLCPACWPGDRVMMLRILPIRRHIRDLQGIDRRGLISTSSARIATWLHEALKVGLPVAVKRQDIVGVASKLRVESLLQEIDVTIIRFDGGLEGSLCLVAGMVGGI